MNRLYILIFFLLFNACQTKQKKLSITPLSVPTTNNVMFPNLTKGTDNQLYLSWMYEPDTISHLNIASYQNDRWSNTQTVATGNDWFVNWADFPSIIQQPDGTILTYYLAKNGAGTYAYDIAIKQSIDQGKTWKHPIIPHRDSTATEHGFVSFFNTGTDQTGIVWLDGRKYAKNTTEHNDHGHGHGEGTEADMTLRFANLKTDGTLHNEAEIDGRICSCCQTDAVSYQDGAIVVYRDRSANEIRDISYLIYTNGAWSIPRSVHNDNWKIAACPVNGPAIDSKEERVAVAWFTNTDATPQVLLSTTDYPASGFQKPIRIDSGTPLGRVDVKFLSKDQLTITWLESVGDKTFLQLKMLDFQGNTLQELIISEYNPSRASGFPRMEVIGESIYLAWTTVNEEGESLKMVKAFY